MQFEWDNAKSERNRATRGLEFAVALDLFDGPVSTETDDREDYGETRMKAVGVARGMVLVCIYTDRGDVRRIISLRRANRKERHGYGYSTVSSG